MDTHESKTWITVAEAAVLSELSPKTIISRIHSGKITGEICSSAAFTEDVKANYIVLLESMSLKIQHKYHLSKLDNSQKYGLDLVSLKGIFGTSGLQKYEIIAEMLSKAAIIRNEYRAEKQLTEKLSELAESYGYTYRTLLRYEKKPVFSEISKLYLDPVYMQDHLPSSMCLLSVDYAYYLKLSKHKKFSNADIFRAYDDIEDEYSCDSCVYREGSSVRHKYCRKSIFTTPICRRNTSNIMKPRSRYVVDDLLRHIPAPLIVFRREGERIWNARFGHFIIRDKPLFANDLFQGDHHIFNCFVRVPIRKTVKGEIIEKEVLFRPVLTAWMDTATGVIVGWIISLLPNAMTIAEAFCRACVYSVGDEFHGLPRAILVDNGKDYRSRLLEDIPDGFENFVPENDVLTNKFLGFGLLPSLNIEIHHSREYHPQSKSIEHFFGIIESRWVSKLSGYCYESAEKRPPGFQRDLMKQWKNGELFSLKEFIIWFQNTCLYEYHRSRHYDTPRVIEPAVTEGDEVNPWEWHTPLSAMSPLEMYRSLPKARDLTPNWKTMAALKMERKRNVSCSSYGIEFSGEYYWHEKMQDITNLDESPSHIDILYNKPILKEEAPLSITVLYHNKFVCEAYIAGHSEFTHADPMFLQEHHDALERCKNEMRRTWSRIYRVIKLSKLVDKEFLRHETYGQTIDLERDRQYAKDLVSEVYADESSATTTTEQEAENTQWLLQDTENIPDDAVAINRDGYHQASKVFYGDLDF